MEWGIIKRKGLILNIYDRGETNATIKVLLPERIIYLIAKGFFRSGSKNRSNILIGSFASIEYFDHFHENPTYLLKKATLEENFDFSSGKHKQFISLLLQIFQMIEISKKTNNIFVTYEKFLKEQDFEHKNYLLTYLLYEVSKTKGKFIHTTKCAVCLSNQNLYTIDLSQGGMLCVHHKMKNEMMTKSILQAFYYLNISFDKYKKYSTTSINNFLFNMFYSFIKG